MDRIDAMRAFVTVVQEGSFTQAAERLDTSPQLVSKYVARLEERLGTRLLNRTTRKIHLTEAGTRYAQHAAQVLDDIEDMENQLGNLQHTAQGQLRISAPVSFAISHMAPLLMDFQRVCPDVTIDLQLNDRKVDIVDEGFDVALRIGRLKSSSLIAKRIAPVRLVACAAPSYLARQGTPQNTEELKGHRILHYSYLEPDADDPLLAASYRNSQRKAAGHLECNNGDLLVQAAIAGAGIAIQPTFITGAAIAAGQLSVVLADAEPEPMGLYAVYTHRKLQPNKVRQFIAFLEGYFGDPPYWDNFASDQAGPNTPGRTQTSGE